MQLYGPGAVFYKLSTACMNTSIGKYQYSVCPFGPVKQAEEGRQSVVIGRRVMWLDRGPAVYRLILDDGDVANCPAGQHRQTTVRMPPSLQHFLKYLVYYQNCHCRHSDLVVLANSVVKVKINGV